MAALQNINLAIRFLLEICALMALGYWGFHTGNGKVTKALLGVGVPILIAVIWGVFGSPKAKFKLSMTPQIFLELVVFGIPVIALLVVGKTQLALIYGICVVINRLLMIVWKQ
ncbi:YrdB family protein [Neobacillus mesonae]|uniref:YrdB family protein n=1 Tax=Neobacillus mesonae TaxID=1193713 RepID=UPI00203BBCB8|nr:YrdB family protein [Neobacillus mesonae]MCM3570159.1 YrdB family protein [Neobacillus mesonae]